MVAAERKTRANGRATRQAILDAAREVFAEQGMRGASLTEIAKRVGVTQPGILHHFDSKEQLLLEVVQAREDATDLAFRELVGRDDEFIRAAINLLADINAHAPVEQLLLTTLSAEAVPPDHPLHAHFVERYRRGRRHLETVLRQAKRHRVIRSDVDVRSTAREMMATLDGLHLQWLLDPDEVDLAEALGRYADRLLRDLGP